MVYACRFFIALFALSAASAQANGIDCAGAATKLDSAICSDPVMREYDARITVAYAGAMSIWGGVIAPYVRLDQQEWRTGFRTIESLEATIDSDCVISDRARIRAELRRRVDDIESGAYVHSGVYRAANGLKLLLSPGRGNGYGIRVFDPARSSAVDIATVDVQGAASWDGSQYLVSMMGDAHGARLPPEDGCTLRLLPRPLAIEVVQQGACQGHRFEGSYVRLLDETLRGYELELH